MKKVLYSLFFFFALFIGTNYVFATDDYCEYSFSIGVTTQKVKFYTDGLTEYYGTINGQSFDGKAVGTIWTVNNSTAIIQAISSGQCPKLYVYDKMFIDGSREITLNAGTNNEAMELTDSHVSDINALVTCTYAKDDRIIKFNKMQNGNYLFCININGTTTCDDPSETIHTSIGDFYVASTSYSELFNFNSESECPSTDKINVTMQTTDFGTTYIISKFQTSGSSNYGDDPSIIDGSTFKTKLKDLYSYLLPIANKKNISLSSLADISVDGSNSSISDLGFTGSTVCSSDCNDESYNMENTIKDIRRYCNNFYGNFSEEIVNSADGTDAKKRYDECVSFNSFYSSLVSNNLVNDLSEGCGILSADFINKLKFILDIVKIAGPILAIGLGTLDFIKTVAAGDPDKEMKTTAKRFMTRIIAAVLLFLIPIFLAFLMDIILGNKDGYNEDNPFCDVVDWNG